MSFPLVCFCRQIPRPIVALFKLLQAVALAFVLILCFLGLYEFPYTVEDHAPLIHGRRRDPLGDDGLQPEAVKRGLPLVEYMQLADLSADCHDGESGYPATCRVCLERLEVTDEVRRLGNCTHAFHIGCIDRWIDLGEVTCPLCRSHLLPRQRRGLLGSRRFG
uniref:RING-type domain-containing protein n=1 Tax=Oryza meridionalis TaxID=40149 RepID=A0A0E0DHL0_9ORYZ